MNANKFSYAKSEFFHAVQMLRNYIAEADFLRKYV